MIHIRDYPVSPRVRRRHHNEILQSSLGKFDLVALYRRCPDMFDFAPLSFRDQIQLLNLDYNVFKTAFKFHPRTMSPDNVFDLYLLDPRKYQRHVKMTGLNREKLEQLVTRRPGMIKNLDLVFSKFTERAWAALLEHDCGYYCPLFFEHIAGTKQKTNLRYIFNAKPMLINLVTPEIAERSCLDSRNYIILIEKIMRKGHHLRILAHFKEYLRDTTMMGILAGKFKKSKQLINALRKLDQIKTR